MGLCNRVLIKEYAQNPCTPLPGLVHESLLHNASSCLPLRAAYAQNTEGGTCNSGRASTKAAGGRVELHGRPPSDREHARCILLD